MTMADVQTVTSRLGNIIAARAAVTAAALEAAQANTPTPPPGAPAGTAPQEGPSHGTTADSGR